MVARGLSSGFTIRSPRLVAVGAALGLLPWIGGQEVSVAAPGSATPSRISVESAVEREWRVRTWAFHTDAAAMLDALGDPRWTARADALDALVRSLESAAWTVRRPPDAQVDALRAALGVAVDDEHPNVRARALEAWSRWPGRIPNEVVPALGRRLSDPLPQVRATLARVLGHPHIGAAAARSRWLLALANDLDAEVAAEARSSVCVLGAAGEDEIVEMLSSADPREDQRGIRTALLLLFRTPPSAAVLERLSAHWRGVAAASGDPRAEFARGHLALCQALSWVAHGVGSYDELAGGWLEPGEELLERRTALLAGAAASGAELAPLLLDALCSEFEQDGGKEHASRASFLLEGALESAGASAFLQELAAEECLTEELEVRAWEVMRSSEVAFTAEETTPWLAPEIAPQVRQQVAWALADAARRGSDPEIIRRLVQLLEDRDAEVSEIAFRSLAEMPECETGCEELMADLCRAWRQLEMEQRIHRLKFLARDRAWPEFSRGLIDLGHSDPGSRGVAAELLGTAAWSEPVRVELERWLDAEIEAVLSLSPRVERDGAERDGAEALRSADGSAGGDERLRAHELRAAEIVRALHRSQGPSAVPALVRTAQSLGERSLEVSKAAIAPLGLTDAGRLWLPRYLQPGVPPSLAVEAALSLAAAGESAGATETRAVRGLARLYASCDSELRDRVLRALGGLSDAMSRNLLSQVACNGSETVPHRLTAVSALASRSDASECAEILIQIAARSDDTGVVCAAVEALGRTGGSHAAEFVGALLSDLQSATAEPFEGISPLSDGDRGRAIASTVHAMAAAGWFTRALEEDWWGSLCRPAGSEVAARLAARPLAPPEVLHRNGTLVARRLAEAGLLRSALERAGSWWRIDGRLLVAIAEAARGSGGDSAEISAELYRSALVALGGEPAGEERAALTFRCRFALLVLAWDGKRWTEFDVLAGDLLEAWRRGAVPVREWMETVGGELPRQEIDGAAWLESARWQARARQALERGDRTGAQRFADRARAAAGHSAAAQRAQAELEQAIASQG